MRDITQHVSADTLGDTIIGDDISTETGNFSESLRKEQENLVASGGQEKTRPVDDNTYTTVVVIH